MIDASQDCYSMVCVERTAGYVPSYNSFADKKTEHFGIFDFLDMVNPLQHIPVVNYAYRYLTGDNIRPISSVIGGAVFGGPVGAASGLVTSVFKPETVFTAAYEKTAELSAVSYMDANYDFNV